MSRPKKVSRFKGKKLRDEVATGTSNVPTLEKTVKGGVRKKNSAGLKEIKQDQEMAASKLAKRKLSTAELGALMSEAPGGAFAGQIAPTRQFRQAVRDLPEMVITEPKYIVPNFESSEEKEKEDSK